MGRKNRIKDYTYPDIVATDDFTNKRVYEETIGKKIPYILDGYSLIMLAYG